MQYKLWETEYWAINFASGKIEGVISAHYIRAVNLEQAVSALAGMNMPWLRVNGNWYMNEQTAVNHNEFYEKLSKPSVLTEDMSFDEFLDWLDLGTESDVRAAIAAFEKDGLTEHVKVMKVHLKLKYGNKKKDDNKDEEEGEATRE